MAGLLQKERIDGNNHKAVIDDPGGGGEGVRGGWGGSGNILRSNCGLHGNSADVIRIKRRWEGVPLSRPAILGMTDGENGDLSLPHGILYNPVE